jgi:cytidine deaminase
MAAPETYIPTSAANKLFNKARHPAHRHAVIVYRGGNIVAMGANHDTTHAEVAALNTLWPSERRGTKVVSLRMRRDGKLGMAKPCAKCEDFMRENGVKTVVYSDANGEMVRMRL